MKYRDFAGVIASSLCLGATMAQAQYNYHPSADIGPYIRADIGPSFFENGRLTRFGGPVSSPVEYDTGLAADLALGWDFSQYVGADFELGYVGARINNVPGFFSDDSHIANVPFLANVTLSLPLPNCNVVPYVGVGAGGTDVIFDTNEFGNGATTVFGSEDDVVFAWQAVAGLRFKLNGNISLGLGYKYFATGKPSFSYPPAPNFPVDFKGARTHSILFTFLLKF
jgi:opacity protein-like surface antigen